MEHQHEYWEDEKVLKRRSVTHPAIEAFAVPKVKRVVDLIERDLGKSVEGMSAVDVGSGNGYFSYYLSKYFDISCLDYSHNILSICPIEKKVQASATEMPFRDSSFDVVFCANILHHVQEPSEVIEEMLRVSSRYIVIIEPNRYNPFMLLLAYLSKADRSITKFSSKYLLDLVKGHVEIISAETSGFILPNKTPPFMVPLMRVIEPLFFPKIYHLIVAKKR